MTRRKPKPKPREYTAQDGREIAALPKKRGQYKGIERRKENR